MSEKDLNPLQVPAFMRKRSIKAKDRRKLLHTALDRKSQTAKKENQLEQQKRKVISGLGSQKVKKKAVIPRKSVLSSRNTYLSDQTPISRMKSEEIIGEVSHYFEKIKVAVFFLEERLEVGEEVWIEGEKILINSMQINRQDVDVAEKGEEVGVKLLKIVSVGAKIIKKI